PSPGQPGKLGAARSAAGAVDAPIGTGAAASALRGGLPLLRPGGHYVTAGLVLPAAPVDLDASLLVRGMLTLRGVHNYLPRHLAQALDFVARIDGQLPFAELVDARIPLDAIDDGFAQAAARR